ncbi:WhiB family transcriptional regulator [Isoptericola sp. NPDC057191]|uniref:WhiB family transcriptional regulator n=1 Tax=Isoptericola sp. NPDC057191 TaxID=3346041 RepID=UPI0036417027
MEAECRKGDPELFFSPEGERGEPRMDREREAKSVCGRCPVSSDCLEYALMTERRSTRYGVWGGQTAEERAVLVSFRRYQ